MNTTKKASLFCLSLGNRQKDRQGKSHGFSAYVVTEMSHIFYLKQSLYFTNKHFFCRQKQ